MNAIRPGHAHAWLTHMPVPLFATVMGYAGLTLAWRKAEDALGLPHTVSTGLMLASLGLFAVLLALYATKLVMHAQAVRDEFAHSVRVSFFPTISISATLLAIPTHADFPALSLALFAAGATLHLGFTLVILSSWIHHTRYEIAHSTPAWFIPIVGNILVPLAGVPHGWIEVSWFFFSIGLVFWIVLLTIMMNRFFFHPPLPAKMLPTLFILIAPPAAGFLSWLALHGGELDAIGRILYYVGLFTTFLLLYQLPRFAGIPFALPWWAYSFPSAAITVATFSMAARIHSDLLGALGIAMLAAVTILVALLTVRTLQAIVAGRIFAPE